MNINDIENKLLENISKKLDNDLSFDEIQEMIRIIGCLKMSKQFEEMAIKNGLNEIPSFFNSDVNKFKN